MKKKLLILAILMLGTSVSQAQWGKRVKGNGDETTETREVGTYERLSVSHIFKVTLVPGAEGRLTLTGDENLLPYVITDVSGGRLKITVEKGVQLQASKGSKGIRVRVPVTDLDEISVSGAADIYSEGKFSFEKLRAESSGASELHLAVSASEIRVQTSGASEMDLEGSTGRLDVKSSGASNFHAFGLSADYVEAQVSGAADVRINASKSLNAQASGAGNIRYKGDPEKINKQSSRAASVKKS